MLYIQEHVQQILSRIKESGCVLLLDFDGTLSPIVQHPADATLDVRTREALSACSKRFTTAIISGRTLADIEARVGIEGIWYAGAHGLEWRIGDEHGSVSLTADSAASIAAAKAALMPLHAQFESTIVEDKEKCFAINYRALSEADATLFRAAAFNAVDARVQTGSLRVMDAMRTFEVVPSTGWNKGTCARMFVERAHSQKPGATPIFIGDSQTDEDAFRELHDGITIRVGKHPDSIATYYLASRDEVDMLLESLSSL